MSAAPVHIGIDGGGSKTELLASSPGRASVALSDAGLNLVQSGIETAAVRLTELIHAALTHFPDQPLGSVCAGLAGAGREVGRAQLHQALLPRIPSTRLLILTDGMIALEAAFPGGSGIALVIGTGSVVMGRTRSGSIVRTGGWGPILGDDGSGVALGRATLRAAGAAFEGGPQTILTDWLEAAHEITSRDTLITRVYGQRWQLQHEPVALLLRAVAAGDPVAVQVLETELSHLMDLVEWMVTNQHPDAFEPRVALMGGLSRAPVYVEALNRSLNERFPAWEVTVCTDRPVHGALRLAENVEATKTQRHEV